MLTILSLCHRHAALAVRARFALGPEDQARLYRAIAGTCGGQAFFLSTCNRVELAVWTGAAHTAESVALVRRIGARLFPRLADDFVRQAVALFDDQAAAHLMRVAGGLESQIPGDIQVLGQLRSAYRVASAAGAIGAELHRLVQTALRAGKRIRRTMELGGAKATAGAAAAAMLLQRLGPATPAPRIAVLGAGQAGAAAAQALVAGGARAVLLNRSPERAERLARRLGAETADFAERYAAVAAADGAIIATSSRAPILEASALAAEREHRRRDMCSLRLLDLSVPVNIEPAVGRLPGVELLTLEDLPEGTLQKSSTADAIIGEEVRYLRQWLLARRSGWAEVA